MKDDSSIFSSKSAGSRDFFGLILRLIAFFFIVLASDRMIFGSGPLLKLVYRFRPPARSVGPYVLVQRQLLKLEVSALDAQPKILIVGSSAVVNGVDEGIVADHFRAAKLGIRPVNVGSTGFLASELPMLRRFILAPGVKRVVFVYNTFSFADGLHPQGGALRWETLEALRLFNLREWRRYLPILPNAVFNELFHSLRYRELLLAELRLWLGGEAAEPPNDFDYPIDEPVPPIRPRVRPKPASVDSWERAIYVESDTDAPTLGYRGFREFLKEARAAAIPVSVIPAPEPDFAEYTAFRQGIHVERVDARAAAIAKEESADYVPRSFVASLESQDHLFRDYVHLHTFGRALFSAMLAEKIIEVERPTARDQR